jgi:DNA polymerase-4
VVIKIRYANFDTETKQCKSGLYLSRSYPDKNVTDLFDKLYQRRMRLAWLNSFQDSCEVPTK